MRILLRTVLLALASLLLLPVMGAATGTVEIPRSRTVTDALDRTVEIPQDPQRIVIAGRAVIMIADALYLFPGASGRVAGIGRINQGKGNFLAAIDPNYGDKAVLERNVGPEQVAGVNPDLVILKSMMRERLGDGIERLGIPVVYVDFETPAQYQRDLRLLGEVMGQPERGRELARYYEQETARIASAVRTALEADASSAQRPRTLFLYADIAGGDRVFNVPPTGWIQTMLVDLAGGEPVWFDQTTGGGWTRVGLEQIAAWDADVMTLVAYRQDVSQIRDELLESETWQTLSSIENDRFHIVPLDFYSWDQPDVRWILGLKWLARTLHPAALPELDVMEEVYDFFAFAYRMSRAEVDEIIVPQLEGVDAAASAGSGGAR